MPRGMHDKIASWEDFNRIETAKPYYKDLYAFVQSEYANGTCYPPAQDIMAALELTPLDEVKCVILGQDPYHNPNEAMGLSFSVRKGVRVPPSLQNIYKELHDEIPSFRIPAHGDLTSWAKQGVLLLNAALTVRAHQPASHAQSGWQKYTDEILRAVDAQDRPVVYMLWGRFARDKAQYLSNPRHLVLESPHPSPYSAGSGFFGNGHFVKCNRFLQDNGVAPIDWGIPG